MVVFSDVGISVCAFGKGSKTSYFGYGTILFELHYAATPERCLLCFVFGQSFPLRFLALPSWKCVGVGVGGSILL